MMDAQPKVVDLKAEKKRRERENYKTLVLQAFDDQEHAIKREMLDRRADVQIKARERL